jgi:DNA-binding protein Fis
LYERLLQLVEPPFLRAVFEQYHGQCATAARHLGLHRTTLRKKLDQYGIVDQKGRANDEDRDL